MNSEKLKIFIDWIDSIIKGLDSEKKRYPRMMTSDVIMGFNQIKKEAELLKSDKTTSIHWEDVKKIKPPVDTSLLLLTDTGIIEGEWSSNYDHWKFISLYQHGCGCCSSDGDKVTHWSNLPETPKI